MRSTASDRVYGIYLITVSPSTIDALVRTNEGPCRRRSLMQFLKLSSSQKCMRRISYSLLCGGLSPEKGIYESDNEICVHACVLSHRSSKPTHFPPQIILDDCAPTATDVPAEETQTRSAPALAVSGALYALSDVTNRPSSCMRICA